MDPTTFVIGAGTSIPFGMPSGFELLKKICQSDCDLDQTRYPFFTHAANTCLNPYTKNPHDDFREKLRTSSFDSVDRFIQDNEEYVDYAKACISHILLQAEKNAAFHCTDALYQKVNQNAFRRLWNAMGQPGDVSREVHRHRFVTFNYDRLLEHFVYTSLRQGQRFSREDAMNVVETLDIVHVYGSLGKYEGETINSYADKVEGSFNASTHSFRQAVKSLSLLLTDRASNENSERVTQHFRDAPNVVVLGFGFDYTNCQYLRNCYLDSLKGTSQEERANDRMSHMWKVCMFEKRGSPVNRARNLLRVGYPTYPKSIGNYDDHDAAFLEHNVL